MKTYHKFLIVFTIFIIIGVVYLYFANSIKSEASLFSSLDSSIPENLISSDDKINSDISFISTLTSLNSIDIDTTLFTSKSFQYLKDNTVRLNPVGSGRLNPFAPINLDPSGNYTSIVTTNMPEIKDKVVVLSGTYNNNIETGVGYFNYGTTKELGQKTQEVTISMIGSFLGSIDTLDSNTNYFYKACIKTKGSTFCGDIVSFKTN